MPYGARSARVDQDPHKNPQPAAAGAFRPARPNGRRAARSPVFSSGTGRPATRGDGDPVIELEYGITVYPAREGGERDQLMANVAAYSGPRWGEIAALTVPQVDTAACVIAVDRMVCGSQPDSGNSLGARCWLVTAAYRFNPESALQSPT